MSSGRSFAFVATPAQPASRSTPPEFELVALLPPKPMSSAPVPLLLDGAPPEALPVAEPFEIEATRALGRGAAAERSRRHRWPR